MRHTLGLGAAAVGCAPCGHKEQAYRCHRSAGRCDPIHGALAHHTVQRATTQHDDDDSASAGAHRNPDGAAPARCMRVPMLSMEASRWNSSAAPRSMALSMPVLSTDASRRGGVGYAAGPSRDCIRIPGGVCDCGCCCCCCCIARRRPADANAAAADATAGRTAGRWGVLAGCEGEAVRKRALDAAACHRLAVLGWGEAAASSSNDGRRARPARASWVRPRGPRRRVDAAAASPSGPPPDGTGNTAPAPGLGDAWLLRDDSSPPSGEASGARLRISPRPVASAAGEPPFTAGPPPAMAERFRGLTPLRTSSARR